MTIKEDEITYEPQRLRDNCPALALGVALKYARMEKVTAVAILDTRDEYEKLFASSLLPWLLVRITYNDGSTDYEGFK